MNISRRNIILQVVTNALAVCLFVLGWIENLNTKDGTLTAYGFSFLKYYTVISNALWSLLSVAMLVVLIRALAGHRSVSIPRLLFLFKYIVAAMLSVTFLVVVFMLAPMLGFAELFSGPNFWYHLIIPVMAIVEFICLDNYGTIKFSATFITLIPTIIYAAVYWTNILVNGVEGNDIYGILTWGIGGGILILAMIILFNWGSALLLRIGKRPPRA